MAHTYQTANGRTWPKWDGPLSGENQRKRTLPAPNSFGGIGKFKSLGQISPRAGRDRVHFIVDLFLILSRHPSWTDRAANTPCNKLKNKNYGGRTTSSNDKDMTLNISISTSDFVMMASDRRLTDATTGEILTERSCKITCFQCANAKGFIAYSGIGRDHERKTPSDWLLEDNIFEKLPYDMAMNRIKIMANEKIGRIPCSPTVKRHTFSVVAFVKPGYFDPIPAICSISNFEYGEEVKAEADAEFAVDIRMPLPENWYRSCNAASVNGAIDAKVKSRFAQIRASIVSGITGEGAAKLAIKFIRDAAFSNERTGTIGSTVDYGILSKDLSSRTGHDVVGGTAIQEGMNIISPGGKIADIYMHGGEGGLGFLGFDPRTKKANIKEFKCPSCRAPIPQGHRKCGRCGKKMKQS